MPASNICQRSLSFTPQHVAELSGSVVSHRSHRGDDGRNLESADPAAAGRLYEIRHNTDKGGGIFATADIAQGTLILCEKPLLTLAPEDRVTDQESLQACLEAKIKALSAEKQQEVYSFRNIKPLAAPPLRYIFEGNALPCGPESKIGGLYSVACLFNHSCIYNANVS